MSGLHELYFVFEQVVNRLNNISFSEHHFIIKGHKPVLHVRLNFVYKPDTVIKQGVKQLGRDVASVCKDLSIQVFCQYFPYLWIPVVNIRSCKTGCYDFSPIIAQQMKFEFMTPSHCAFAIGGHPFEYLVGI